MNTEQQKVSKAIITLTKGGMELGLKLLKEYDDSVLFINKRFDIQGDRINKIESIISAFSLYIVLKPNSFTYHNKNFYHFKYGDRVWDAQNYTQERWPDGYMVAVGNNKKVAGWGYSLIAMT